MAHFEGEYALVEYISLKDRGLTGGMLYSRACIAGGHVSLEDMWHLYVMC